MKVNKIFIFVLLLACCTSCHHKAAPKIKCKYMVEKEMKGLNFGIYVLSENKKDSSMNVALRINTLNNTNVLEFGITDKNAYLQRIYYFSYQVENDIWIEQDGKRITASGAVFERNYNLTKDVTVTVHFDNVVIDKKKTLVYYPEPFDLTPLKFRLK